MNKLKPTALVVLLFLVVAIVIFQKYNINNSVSTEMNTTVSQSNQLSYVCEKNLNQPQCSSPLGYVSCSSSRPEFSCNVTYPGIAHNIQTLLINETTNKTVNLSIILGTTTELMIGQRTGYNWKNVSIAFVPKGAQFVNGVPTINFASYNAALPASGDLYNIVNGSWTFALFVPVSTQKYGNFSGQIWIQYYVSGKSSPQYANIGNIIVNAISPSVPKTKITPSAGSGLCTSTYPNYICSNPQLIVYRNYSTLEATGYLLLNLTELNNSNNLTNARIWWFKNFSWLYCGKSKLPSMIPSQKISINISTAARDNCFSPYSADYSFFAISNSTQYIFNLTINNYSNYNPFYYPPNGRLTVKVYPTIINVGS